MAESSANSRAGNGHELIQSDDRCVFEPVSRNSGWLEGSKRWAGGKGSLGMDEETYATTRSGPVGSGVRTIAGRTFEAVRSVKGKGTRITSPLRSGRVKPVPRHRGSRHLPRDRRGTQNFPQSRPLREQFGGQFIQSSDDDGHSPMLGKRDFDQRPEDAVFKNGLDGSMCCHLGNPLARGSRINRTIES